MFTRPAKTLRPPLAVPPRPGPAPRCSSHLPGLWVTRHQRGFTHVRPSGLPLACAPGWSGNASASSLSFAPRSCPRRTSGRGLALNTGQKLCHRHHRPSSLQAHSHHATSCRTSSAQSSPTNSTPASLDPSPHLSAAAAGGEHRRPNGTVLTPAAGTTPLQWCCSPHGRRGHGLCQGLDHPPSLRECSLTGRYRIRVCRVAGPVSPIRFRCALRAPGDENGGAHVARRRRFRVAS